MIELKEEFKKRMKEYLDASSYDKFIKSFNEPIKTGFMLNKKKLNESKIDIHELEKDWSLTKDYECDGYIYYIYDKDLLEKRDIYPGKSIYHHAGLIYIQEPSSNRVLRDIDFKNKKIIDLCAAPGGKCIQTAFSADFNADTKLIANEIDKERKKALLSNIERTGYYDKIKVLSFDPSINIDSDKSNIDKNIKNEIFDFDFDIVIIDAPCSGEGMMRKSPAAVSQWSESLVKDLSALQKKIIDTGIAILNEGGILSYSTCTYSREEDEENVDYILNKYKNMELMKVEKIYHFEGIGEGQFYARFKKKS